MGLGRTSAFVLNSLEPQSPGCVCAPLGTLPDSKCGCFFGCYILIKGLVHEKQNNHWVVSHQGYKGMEWPPGSDSYLAEINDISGMGLAHAGVRTRVKAIFTQIDFQARLVLFFIIKINIVF